MQLVNIFGDTERFEEMADILYNKASFHPENSKDF
jgi:hypothetical protein